MLKFLIMVGVLFSLNGCVKKMQVIDFKNGTSLDAKFDKGTRQVTVVMPNNDVLTGQYSAVSNATFTMGNSYNNATVNAYSSGYGNSYGGGNYRSASYSGTTTANAYGRSSYQGVTSGGVSNAYALLKSNTSKLMMEMIVQYSDFTGHGYGEARTNDGRQYKVQF